MSDFIREILPIFLVFFLISAAICCIGLTIILFKRDISNDRTLNYTNTEIEIRR